MAWICCVGARADLERLGAECAPWGLTFGQLPPGMTADRARQGRIETPPALGIALPSRWSPSSKGPDWLGGAGECQVRCARAPIRASSGRRAWLRCQKVPTGRRQQGQLGGCCTPVPRLRIAAAWHARGPRELPPTVLECFGATPAESLLLDRSEGWGTVTHQGASLHAPFLHARPASRHPSLCPPVRRWCLELLQVAR